MEMLFLEAAKNPVYNCWGREIRGRFREWGISMSRKEGAHVEHRRHEGRKKE